MLKHTKYDRDMGLGVSGAGDRRSGGGASRAVWGWGRDGRIEGCAMAHRGVGMAFGMIPRYGTGLGTSASAIEPFGTLLQNLAPGIPQKL